MRALEGNKDDKGGSFYEKLVSSQGTSVSPKKKKKKKQGTSEAMSCKSKWKIINKSGRRRYET